MADNRIIDDKSLMDYFVGSIDNLRLPNDKETIRNIDAEQRLKNATISGNPPPSTIKPPIQATGTGQWTEPGKLYDPYAEVAGWAPTNKDMTPAEDFYGIPSMSIPAVPVSHHTSYNDLPFIEDQPTSQGINSAIDPILNRLADIEKKISGINASFEAGEKSVANTASQHKKTAQPISPGRKMYEISDADISELEKLLNGDQPINNDKVQTFRIPPEQWQELQKLADKLYNDVINSGVPGITATQNMHIEREDIMAKNKAGWVTERDGTQRHYTAEGVLHSDKGPAEVRKNGTQLFYKNGTLHREGGHPAMLGSRGTEKFAVDGKYHRLGGLPAITWSKGPFRFEWWEDGEIIRSQKKDGTQEWYAPGATERDEAVLHREDGPAVMHQQNGNQYWLHGKQYRSEHEWIAALEKLRIERDTLESLDGTTINDEMPAYIQDETVQRDQQQVKEKKMSKPSFTETLKANAASAGYRVAGTQLTNLVKQAILNVMRGRGADDGALAGITAFLDTEFGAALISFAIGSGLNYVPGIGEDERVVRLAEELRVGGMATAGNAVMGEALQHILPAVSQILSTLPEASPSKNENVRVIESKETSKLASALEEEESEETETVTARKTMNA